MNVGDTVKLKSGGPLMTVDYRWDEKVDCTWFEGTENRRASFSTASLEKQEKAKDTDQ
jgi:uncharacterized protein YodC (DUF2158 family)